MTEYDNLTPEQQKEVDAEIVRDIPYGFHQNKGFSWYEPQYTLERVHLGICCAKCFNIHYNCVCSHDD